MVGEGWTVMRSGATQMIYLLPPLPDAGTVSGSGAAASNIADRDTEKL
jgi:hypothetical protein